MKKEDLINKIRMKKIECASIRFYIERSEEKLHKLGTEIQVLEDNLDLLSGEIDG